ncbi:hypothetical protein SAMN05880590_10517 [Rhizobium sp. RU35A]|uniref:Uncharacterized protein n=1 Tax=Rhizobium straminoryzae TaxID=1387186 RepID=A0A549SRL9_9HYPH|nr:MULTISPECIES: hypothetical protein [Rhizobium]TRL32263.1 hypothetical protein FNA46_23660 [Rhizobium straminoryzae]SIQ52806.1 hypothetical protein SAMN05880590_10517 [Rhizobium sp. RU35A]
MKTDTELLCAQASALSSAALLTSLIGRLVQNGVLSQDDEKAIYTNALDALDENGEDDPSGVFDLARELIEDQIPSSSETVTLTLVSASA